MTGRNQLLCDDRRLEALVILLSDDEAVGLQTLEQAIEEFPSDARLHFLRGSVLIGMRRLVGAHGALARAVELDPGFHLARFQLGFFELTSGEADAAIRTWAPLDELGPSHWITHFVAGLKALVQDDFVRCSQHLETGIAMNTENLPLNGDMRLILEQCRSHAQSQTGAGTGGADESAFSETSFLLGLGRKH